jgi:hypothetical protein
LPVLFILISILMTSKVIFLNSYYLAGKSLIFKVIQYS